MKQGWRWYGAKDAISLKEIRQAGVTDVVAALYDRKCGEVWPVREIKELQRQVAEAGMTWSVVESVPIHESIKTRTGDFAKYVANYKATLRNLAACGIRVVCCNFMPVLDWTRSNLAHALPDGSRVLQYDDAEVAMFDLFILKRRGAARDYTEEVRAAAREKFETLSPEARQAVADAILLGLPGTVDNLTVPAFKKLLATYRGIGDRQLRENFYAFLNEIRPLCDKLGMRIAIHPDDPPRPIFGLPRVASTAADFREMCERVPSDNIGLTFCTGSLGGNPDCDEVALFAAFAPRIHFVHFRNVVYTEGRSFRESECHLTGKVDMARLMKLLIREEARRGESIVVRPDHGRLMEIDKFRTCYAGYSYGGRLVGLAELRGLEYGLRHGDDLDGRVVAVTGAAGVLCRVLCEDFLLHGARVALIGRHLDKLEALQAELAKKGLGETLALEADVLDRAAVERARDAILARWGRIDALVNGAGGNHPGGTTPAERMTPDTPLGDTFFGLDQAGFEQVFRLNLVGTLVPCQVFGKVLCDQGGGSILNFCSMASFRPLTKVGAYGAAKAGVENFTYWLATHLAPMNIRVNALAPGFFLSEQNRFLLVDRDGRGLTARGGKVIGRTPMGRFGQPSDLCGAARFLLSDGAAFVTGVVLPVDGGFLAYSGV